MFDALWLLVIDSFAPFCCDPGLPLCCSVGVPTLDGSFGPGLSPGAFRLTLSPGTVGGKLMFLPVFP